MLITSKLRFRLERNLKPLFQNIDTAEFYCREMRQQSNYTPCEGKFSTLQKASEVSMFLALPVTFRGLPSALFETSGSFQIDLVNLFVLLKNVLT